MKKILLSAILLTLFTFIYSQELTQTIRGRVIDKTSGTPLVGATVVITGFENKGVITDLNGNFRIPGISTGRHELSASFLGYRNIVLSNLIVSSGKELLINIELEEKVSELQEVVVTANARKDRVKNEMAVVSARTFTIEETEKYAGAMGDVARMAANFAGVSSISDQQNEIVIRGNSPVGLLWRMNGVDIPNPNHFSSVGGTGGAISALNNNVLANSDFYTSAFPAQYGNALSGVFDLRMRNGNDQKYEFTAQMAFNGLELGAEGPLFKRKDSLLNPSFIVNYRYSTMAIVDKFIGLEKLQLMSVPYYQDLSFKVNIPTKKMGIFSVWGLGGLSSINPEDYLKDSAKWETKYIGHKVDFSSNMGVFAVSHKYFIGNKANIQTSLYSSINQIVVKHDTFTLTNLTPKANERMSNGEITYGVCTDLNYKVNRSNNLVAGITMNTINYQFIDSMKKGIGFVTYGDIDKYYSQLKSYAQWRTNINDKFEITSGVNYQLFTYNSKYSIDPRIGAKWFITPKQSVNLGAGMVSFIAPRFIYAQESVDVNGNRTLSNRNLDMFKARHYVAGYDNLISQHLKMKFEVYYQYLYDIPVSKTNPGYSLLNLFSGFDVPNMNNDLVNKGTGKNYGVELTLEKYLSDDYYFLITNSVFKSTYTDINNVERNTAFSSNFAINALAGYELKIKKNKSLNFDIKGAWGGSRRYVPSYAQQVAPSYYEQVYDWNNAYEERYPDYFRINLRVGFRLNKPKYNLLMAMDFINITNHKNIFMREFDQSTGKFNYTYQFPFMPIGMIRVQF